jgi:hypothetical protein
MARSPSRRVIALRSSAGWLILAALAGCVDPDVDTDVETDALSSSLPPVASMTPEAKLALGRRFAPLVNLHPQDRYRPGDAGAYYASATPMPDATLRVPDTWTNVRGEPVDGGVSRAPAYVRVADHQGSTFIQYYFFYGTNGCQGFRAGTGTPFTPGQRTFDWCDFGYHEADWEHITVRLTPDRNAIERIHYATHGWHGRWYGPEEIGTENGHPIVFSALNSHASYPSDRAPYDFFVAEPLPISLPVILRSLVTGDIVGKDVKLDTYERQPFSDYVRWPTWERLVVMDDQHAPDWWWYWGAWGERRTNGATGAPGSLPGDVRALLSAGASIASAVGALDRYKNGDPPWGPRYQGPWTDFDHPPATVEACFYADADFGGDRACYGQGRVASVGDWNDRFSSVRLYGGATARVFQDGGFGARAVELTADVADLGALSFNDQASSLEVAAPVDQACFYSDIDFHGARTCHRVGDLGFVGGWNDQFSSVQLFGTSVRLFEHADLGGESRWLTGSVPDLRDVGFNDRVSSVQVVARPEVCFFGDDGFRGERTCFGPGDVAELGGLNDTFSSLQVSGGAVVQIYGDWYYGGGTLYFPWSAASLGAWGFNDATSSFRIWH